MNTIDISPINHSYGTYKPTWLTMGHHPVCACLNPPPRHKRALFFPLLASTPLAMEGPLQSVQWKAVQLSQISYTYIYIVINIYIYIIIV